ncbi:heavy metal translocating P-type ATPase [Saccharicrinis aurantiacus]|uniref:heavy metal translocating P-type ATPase n=1 Tax=Saccharicrinis aurantiacus TaxID=1849719 RepID=UPI0024936930|nr:heavy metal translocating P-type ATPase metal-binding domain-containing protein [Saccharicrinis aurantiacus]
MNKCVHCGADCGKHPIEKNGNLFCCNGCQTVFEMLNGSEMQQYYEFEQQPGIRLNEVPHQNKYAYLDNDEVKEKLYDFFDNGIAKVTFYIPTIHCASCIWLLEHLNKLNEGVKYGAVNFVKKTYTVSFDTEQISLRQLVELLVSIHYIPDISLQDIDGKEHGSKQNKSLIYKIGVAGFVFGNVMLYSLPEYFNGEAVDGSFGVFLYYLMYVLTIPLVFYSGSDYLISAFKNLRKGIVNIDLPIAIGILALFAVTSYEVLLGIGPGYSDSLSGFLFFLLLGRWYQSKTYQALAFDRDYKSYFPVAVTRITDEVEESVLLKNIEVGNQLLIRNKELIPADSVLVSGNALIDYSFVTGESVPVIKKKDDFLYAGGIQTGGAIVVKIDKEVEQSHLTQLWNQSEKQAKSKRSLTSIIDRISGRFTIAVIIIAVAGFSYWMLQADFKTALMVLTSVLIVACPCALALSLPFTFGSAMRVLGQKGMYLKNIDVIEKLTTIDTIVFDKTGTLTKPEESSVKFVGNPLTDHELNMVLALAKQSTHPLSAAVAANYSPAEALQTIGFTEIAGRGLFATINQMPIKLGSLEYVSGEAEAVQQENSAVYISINNQLRGYFKVSNQYREGIEEVIAALKSKYDLYLLSGDNDGEKENLLSYFESDKIRFNQKPQDKQNFILQLKEEGRRVLMTGDGLNDSGAFLSSDVALSLADDIYHFSPAGDAILEAKHFSRLHQFVRYAQKSLRIVKQSFIISICYNFIGLAFAISGNLSPVVAAILMPVSSITVVVFTTFSTRWAGKKI